MVFRTEHTVREIINKEVVSELETTVIIIEKKKKTGPKLKKDESCISNDVEEEEPSVRVEPAKK